MAKPKSKIKEPEKNIRPPIVVVMGHVDHGKTKILDYIRKAKVAEGESGGITQHIGAYEAAHKGSRITFIDTPGHEAFSAMRSRGAHIADIAILVVAAEEGVKPQTKEAIKIIKDAKIPYVVALNKIDKEGANPDKVKQELAENDLQVESWGGKIPSVNVSAKTGDGMDELLDTILLLAELEGLVWDPSSLATGVVIESHRDNQVGNTATLLLRDGTLTKKHFLVFSRGTEHIKMMKDFAGRQIDEARASMPVVLSGFHELPAVGESFRAFETGDAAEHYRAEEIAKKITAEEATVSSAEVTEEKKDAAEEGAAKETKQAMSFSLILKSDVAGSKEALDAMLGA
ncbi:MAG: GTP-binding protein, partial [bacterium]|nr:GTP-binding protein [bacterium]